MYIRRLNLEDENGDSVFLWGAAMKWMPSSATDVWQ